MVLGSRRVGLTGEEAVDLGIGEAGGGRSSSAISWEDTGMETRLGSTLTETWSGERRGK